MTFLIVWITEQFVVDILRCVYFRNVYQRRVMEMIVKTAGIEANCLILSRHANGKLLGSVHGGKMTC